MQLRKPFILKCLQNVIFPNILICLYIYILLYCKNWNTFVCCSELSQCQFVILAIGLLCEKFWQISNLLFFIQYKNELYWKWVCLKGGRNAKKKLNNTYVVPRGKKEYHKNLSNLFVFYVPTVIFNILNWIDGNLRLYYLIKS